MVLQQKTRNIDNQQETMSGKKNEDLPSNRNNNRSLNSKNKLVQNEIYCVAGGEVIFGGNTKMCVVGALVKSRSKLWICGKT